MIKIFAAGLAAGLATLLTSGVDAAAAAKPVEERFVVVAGGAVVGHLDVALAPGGVTVDYDVKNNGRGPTIKERLAFNGEDQPTAWSISGATTFGSPVAERYELTPSGAAWSDASGAGSAPRGGLYIAQSASPYANEIYARALLKAPGRALDALPGGRVRLEAGESLELKGPGGPVKVQRFDLSGIDLEPSVLLLTEDQRLFAEVSAHRVLIRRGFEGEAPRLAALAARWSTARFENLQSRYAHRYAGPVRLTNVRVFDPRTRALTGSVAVLVSGSKIAAIEPADAPPTPGETVVDGEGGVLVPGFFEMHGHLQESDALLNLLAGVTSVRDMGNDNAVLADLDARIGEGRIAGPRIVKSGFIEGRSPFSAHNGILVGSQAEALDAVRWYAARGYWQIKIYNSMNPAWAPAMAAEAHRLGLRVAGHVPAFSTADAMIEAGYDEITHINQFMLGWVIKPDEDTRTLFRLTALKRLPALDLGEAKVRRTVQMMVDGHKAIDPTLGIHEDLTLNRDGHVPPGAADYFDHMPIGWRRDEMKALADVSAPGDDAAYRAAFDKILETVRLLHDRGVFIVFGTDTGGSFTYHRELELYQKVGMTPGEILARATLEAAQYLGEGESLGSVEKGKFADFMLVPRDPTTDLKAIKTIRLVVKDGVFYYPTEIYPLFGISPFTTAPRVRAPT